MDLTEIFEPQMEETVEKMTPEQKEERMKELQQMLLDLEEEKKQTYSEWRQLSCVYSEVEQEMLVLMKEVGAETAYTPKGDIFKISDKGDRKYLDDVLLRLEDKVPKPVWDKIHKIEVVHKWHWGHMRRMALPLGDNVKAIIEEGVMPAQQCINIKRAASPDAA